MWVSLRHCSNGFLVLNVMSCNLQENTLLTYWCPIQLSQSQSKSTKNTNMIILTTLSNPKYAVGPKGRWLIVIPSGTPRCSWTRITSVKSCARQVSIISLITCKKNSKKLCHKLSIITYLSIIRINFGGVPIF